ncbi:Piso0_004168 [Millerozyma farinosa CBS 7064]|uniref:Piso0_004168 protein n=1 Tax=Pichia sorbitophila (strain ATCC MYA-4447 / BCRC 22081 / CBS 7064 / NBRC 10061 / NRRL Y-12695) TaxID=559304 RepID=G8YAK4_PICSO|nr:Piso0_004168 [Millerozyma farinosa CBS 7064]CCE84618.1 Piso0_004168 [Millerozyma farinosa CBS 7064]
MFSRRKKTSHNTAYTGVNHAQSAYNQPNNNALAAALTIGENMKGGPTSNANGPRRSMSMNNMNKQYVLNAHDGRSGSITSSRSSRNISGLRHGSLRSNQNALSTPPRSSSRQLHTIDDAFLEEDEHNDVSFSSEDHNRRRRAELNDLRLSRPLSPPSSSYSNSSGPTPGPQRMVKKYIPTPTGIKIIDVPEEKFQKEVARANSIRSTNAFSRSNSLRNINRIPHSHSRSQSLNSTSHFRPKNVTVKAPELDTMKEDANEEIKQSELDKLEQELLQMREKSDDLELKLKRLQDAKKNKLKEKNNETLNGAVDGNKSINAIGNEAHDSQASENGDLNESDVVDNEAEYRKPHIDGHALSDHETDEESKLDEASLSDTLEDEVITDASIDASRIKVDEVEGKKKLKSDEKSPYSNSTTTHDDMKTTSGEELRIISQYSESKDNLKSSVLANDKDEILADSEIADKSPEKNSLAKHLRPKFDNNPEIIDDSLTKSFQKPATLQVPGSNKTSSNSSIRSSQSSDAGKLSPSPKRPVKSAMKNSSSFHSSSNSGNYKNPAQEAYISLTTAENTRLNSKLSSSQLREQSNMQNNNLVYHFSSQQFDEGRMSRRTPSKLAARTLRPQSNNFETAPSNGRSQAGNMSGRNFRYSEQYQPGTNFTSAADNAASKQKVAQLYARANTRPFSFTPSSPQPNSKNENDPSAIAKNNNNNRKTLTTLRDLESDQNEEDIENGGFSRKSFKSRILDSDDEGDNYESHNQVQAPSTLDKPKPTQINLNSTTQASTDTSAAPKNQNREKKKFSKLRKLFGKN